MRRYLALIDKILMLGSTRGDRTGTGTRSLFGEQLRFYLDYGFPLLTTKRIHLKSIIHELLWFIRGDTNTAYLKEHGVKIWDEWGDEKGEIGPSYGHQWRSWPSPHALMGVDQLADVIETIRTDPDSRRMIVSAWNVADIPSMALPPCHMLFQFYVSKGFLSCQMYQRSADVFLGLPFNIASYALLTMMVAQVTGLRPGKLVITLGDAHLYLNHLDQARIQSSRSLRTLPVMTLNPEIKEIDDFRFTDFTLHGYDPHPHIKAPVAV